MLDTSPANVSARMLFVCLSQLRGIREMAKIDKMMDFRNFRMPDVKCRKVVKIMDFRIFRMSDGKCRKMTKIMDFRIFPDVRFEMSEK